MRLRATVWVLGPTLLAGAWGVAAGCGGRTIEERGVPGSESGSVGAEADAIAEDAGVRPEVELEPQQCEELALGYDLVCEVTTHSLGANARRDARNNVLLVVEKSASLGQVPDAYGVSKWEALQTALSSALYDYRSFLSLGLQLFPTSATDPASDPIPLGCREAGRCCEMPAGTEPSVPVHEGEVALPSILQLLTHTTPSGACPTTEALARAHEYFTTGPGAGLAGDDYVLLVTDGLPNCAAGVPVDCVCEGESDPPADCPYDSAACCVLNNPDCLVDADTVDQINDLRSAGVSTIVVGLPGSEPFGDHLWEFADAGGYADASGITTYYAPHTAGTVSGLTDTLRWIASDLAGACEIPLLEEVPNLNQVNVVVDCEVVPRGELDGDVNVSQWAYDHEDPEQAENIVLIGPICARVSSEPLEQVDVVYGCPLVHPW